VDSQFRRRGLARLLSAAAERDAKRRGRKALRLEVRADDRGAVRFYETSGYRHFGKRRRYYGGHVDALRFAKTFTKELPPRSLVLYRACSLSAATPISTPPSTFLLRGQTLGAAPATRPRP